MKTLISLLALLALASSLVAAAASGRTQQLTNPEAVPDGLSATDWASIRQQIEQHRHRAVAVEGGYHARNPRQQWLTRFDGRGFLARPEAGGWEWGLELQSYGFAGQERALTGRPRVSTDGPRVTYDWNATLQEWVVNDQRGLEHGFTITERPPRASELNPHPPTLNFLLAVRGGLRPEVTTNGRDVRFVDAQGSTALTYTGLTVRDAEGRLLPAWFEALGSRRRESPDSSPLEPVRVVASEPGEKLRLVVEEHGALYPLTIDPIAQQAYLKASTADVEDHFGEVVAISGDTVVVGTTWEDSAATGVNGNQTDNSAKNAGAAYVFVRSGTGWTQQAYLKASNTESSGWDKFGCSAAISGDTVVVGAFLESSAASGVNGNQADNSAYNAGAAYVFVRSGTTWSQQAYLKASNTDAGDFFGISVAISGDTVVVGADCEDSAAMGVNGNQSNNSATNSGAAYVFVRSGTTWTQQAYLKASDTAPKDVFGCSVAVSGDTVVVGAVNKNTVRGVAYVFVRSGTIWSQQGYLTASNADPYDHFGCSVAISGDTVVVGADCEQSSATGVNGDQTSNGASKSGAAYVFVRSGTTWSQQAYLKASNTQALDFFGQSVAISGDTVVVGAPSEDSAAVGVNGDQSDNSAPSAGAAYVFVRSGTMWSQQAYLKASNTDADDCLGYSVAISGDKVVAGAYLEDNDDWEGDQAGASYVFFMTTDIVVEQPVGHVLTDGAATVDFGRGLLGTSRSLTFVIRNAGEFVLTGLSISITGPQAGDFVVTTAPTAPVPPGVSTTFTVRFAPGALGLRTATLQILSNDSDESPFDIRLSGEGLTPDQLVYLKASNTDAVDAFGYSMAISGDTVVVGAHYEDSAATGVNGNQSDNSASAAGAAYIFVGSGTTWSQQAYLKASNTEAGDHFGLSVAISGDTVVVGAYYEDSAATGIDGNQNDNSATDSGAAYVFVRSGTTWSQQAYLKASNTGAGDYFGGKVAVSGDTIVVGADCEDGAATGVNGNQGDNSAPNAGAAYIFVRSGTTWSQQAYLKASNTEADDNFGLNAAISGETVVVGAYGEDSAATGVNGNQADNSASGAGAVYVFVRSGTTWSQQAYLKASNTGGGDRFYNVAVLGDTVVVGADYEASAATGVNGNQSDNSAASAGAAYVFVRTGTTWSQQAYLKASNTGQADRFGHPVAISGDTVVVGAYPEASASTWCNGDQSDNGAPYAGAAYVFVRSGTTWSQHAYLKASNTDALDSFGVSVAISGDTVVVGADGEDSAATGVNGNQSDNSASYAGAAYVFVGIAPTAPALSVSPTALSHSCIQGTDAASQSFDVWNSGTGTLNYTVSEGLSWLSCSPTSGVSTGEHDTITVNYSTAGLAAGTYNGIITVNAVDASSSPRTVAVTLTITSPPTITVQPTDVTVLEGQPASFIVVASGTEPLHYQWYFNGTALPGVTRASCGTLSAQASQAGAYSVVVTNAGGSVTSSVAYLYVLIPPHITLSPQSQTVAVGADVWLSGEASGTVPLSYQWTFNGANLGGATGNRLFLTNAQLTNAGNYALVVTNLYGSATSAPAVLTVSADQAVVVQWNFNSPVPDADSSTGTLDPYRGNGTASYVGGTGPSGSGFFQGSSRDPAPSDNSSWRTTAYPPQGQPWNNKSGGVRFNVSTAGRQNIVIEWDQYVTTAASKYWRLQYTLDGSFYFDVPTATVMNVANTFESKKVFLSGVPGANNNPLFGFRIVAEYENSAIGSPNMYYVPVGALPAVYQTNAPCLFDLVTVYGAPVPAPYILADPASQTVMQGEDAIFTVSAAGCGPLSYRWQFNGTPIAGATAESYTVVQAQLTDAGAYSVVVANAGGSVTSTVATLTVVPFQAPKASTLAAIDLISVGAVASATLNGTVNPNGSDTVAWFEWGNRPNAYTDCSGPVTVGTGGSPVIVSCRVSNLVAGGVYQYRVVASNSVGVVHGDDRPFRPLHLKLQGGESLYHAAGAPFIDPGTTVSAAPLAVAGGMVHSLVLRADGTPVGCGAGTFVADPPDYVNCGQALTPADATNVVAIAAGGPGLHSLALRADGTVLGWGHNAYGQATGVPNWVSPEVSTGLVMVAGQVLTNAVAIAAGGMHSLALRADGTILGWGDDWYGQSTPPPSLTNVVAIAAGELYSLALRADGTVVGWGAGTTNSGSWPDFGQASIPAAATNVVAIAAGGDHSLALRANGSIVGWGRNDIGQATVPPSATNVAVVAAGGSHSLSLRANGTVIGWGNNVYGATAIPASATSVVAIEAGSYYSLALRADGRVIGWGQNNYGQINLPVELSTLNLPIAVTGSVDVNTGTYLLTYTATNAQGAVATASRTVVVAIPTPQFSDIHFTPDGSLALTVTGTAGMAHLVEWSTNLVHWWPLTTVLGNGGPLTVTDPDAPRYAYRFYRARSTSAYPITDFEAFPVGATALFRQPSYSGSTSGYVDASGTMPNYTWVTNVFPSGNLSAQVLHAAWTWQPGSGLPWLRLTTHNAPNIPNPIVGFQQAIRFDIFTDKDLYVAFGLRETNPSGAIGEDGGASGTIEWLGGLTDNTTSPPKGHLIRSNQWTTVHCFIPYEPLRAFTGNALLNSTTGKGVLEELTLVPASSGYGPYNLYIDNLWFVDLLP